MKKKHVLKKTVVLGSKVKKCKNYSNENNQTP